MPEQQDHIFKAIFYVCTAFFMLTLMQALNKLLTGLHAPLEIAFYRSFIGIVPCLLYVVFTRRYHLLKGKRQSLMWLRAVVALIGLVLTYEAVQRMPLADATVLFFFSTLLVPVLAVFILKEKIGAHRWAAVIIGMIGVLLVTQPKGDVTLIGVFIALGAATMHGVIQVLLRIMRDENPFTIIFYFFLGGIIVPGFFMPFIATMPTMQSAIILAGIGLTGGLGQLFLTKGFQIAPTSLLSPFAYTGLIWATGLDILIWNYIPGWPVYLGAAIIISSNLYILHREKIAAQKRKKNH